MAGFTPRQPQWDWRAYLTEAEAAAVAEQETRQRAAKKALREATAQVSPIRNRAIHRAKFAAQKNGAAHDR